MGRNVCNGTAILFAGWPIQNWENRNEMLRV
jgi:hypothetical protein